MTFLRGMAPTDASGYVQMITKFPGFYDGPTVHIHVIAHVNGSVLPNGTYSGGAIVNVGYIYFDQSLITEVMRTKPYSENNLTFVTNVDDYMFVDEAKLSDQVLEYVFLGQSVKDGIFGWKTFGLDPTASVNVSVASYFQADGGHTNPDDNYAALHTPPASSSAVGGS
jgi:hypothetical protein